MAAPTRTASQAWGRWGSPCLNCRAVTQLQGPGGGPRVTHVRGGGRGSGDRHLSGRFSTNVLLHGNHTCCASRTGQTERLGGLEGSGRPSRLVPPPTPQTTTTRKGEITIPPVHEKKSRTLSPYFQFASFFLSPSTTPPSLH